MKKYFKTILIINLLLGCYIAKGQESVVISSDMFKDTDQIVLDDFDEWIFHPGNDAGWAEKEIDVSHWVKLKPSELSVKNVDDSGKIEGWFRIRLTLDSSLTDRSFFWYKTSFEAVDLYVDGKLVHSYGTLEDNIGYEPYLNFDSPPVPADLNPAKDHLIAVHFLESTFLFPKRLKSQLSGPWTFLSLTGQDFYAKWESDKTEALISQAIVLSLCIVLSFFFWILVWQNQKDSTLLLIAIFSTLFTVALLAGILATEQVSFHNWWIYFASFILFIFVTMGILPLVVSQIFTHKVSTSLKWIFFGQVLFGIANMSIIWAKVPLLISAIICFSICIYFIYANWKTLRGAQWAIVGGIVLMLVLLMSTLLSLIFQISIPAIRQIFGLPLPLSMLIYVSIRFREMLTEVQINADEVVKIAAEKQALLESQNEILEDQVKSRTKELTQSLQNLKNTQAQLIQSEKMASLGELTAGIAHEIQNPLNFVNNFSEINSELIDEMQSELKRGKFQEVEDISNDIKENEEKIKQHGKRADAIIKNMLQHSRSNSGEKQLTDINALCDEYLRLAYHGYLAKDQSFNGEIRLDLDSSLPKIKVVPQDIGRVLLNLINNAFQACTERNRSTDLVQYGDGAYIPQVTVSTKKLVNQIEITVSDNGPGIPDEIKDKIFQPFFTTKPTGQGTGLGLSLSYDIVSKGHSGEIKVHTSKGEGSEFIVLIPSN